MSKRVWQIRGWDGNKLIFERKIPVGMMSEREVRTLLQRLYSRHLTDEEIYRGSLRRNQKEHATFFEIQPILNIGDSVTYVARATDMET